MYFYMVVLGVMTASVAIVLMIVSFTAGYYMGKQRVRAAREQIHLSKTESVYHLSRDCSSLDGARTARTLNLCSRRP